MQIERWLLFSLLGVLVLSACIMTAPPDPCASQPDSDQCNLVQAQVRVTLAALHRTQTAEANTANQLATVTAYAPTATEIARQTATASATMATATEAAHQTATATAAIPTATEAARLAGVSTAIASTATATAAVPTLHAQATLDALHALDVQSQTNQKNIDVALSGFFALALGLIELLLIIVVPIGCAVGVYHLAKIIGHWLRVKAATVRSSPSARGAPADTSLTPIDSPYFLFPKADGSFDVIDPDRMIGAHIDSQGHGQPLDDPNFAGHAAQWKALNQASARDQLVELYRRSMGGTGSAPLQICAPQAENEAIIPGEYVVVDPNSAEMSSWLDEVEQRLLKAGAA